MTDLTPRPFPDPEEAAKLSTPLTSRGAMTSSILPPKKAGFADGLYARYLKPYPRLVSGAFRRFKWITLFVLLGIYYLAPFLRWDRGPGAPDQAILIDMPARRAYFFFIEIWPQEVYYLTGILIVAAIVLFAATSLFGRVWCGFACFQTVWTDLFLWVEAKIEGDRTARMQLDKAPWTAAKLGKKIVKHLAFILIGFFTGGAWVMYFNDAPTVIRELATFSAGPWTTTFFFLFTFTTYIMAGWAREQACIYMCPYARFQGAMLDEDSLIITYEAWRGEPRAPVAKGQTDFAGRGHCVDCKACVQVCPTGIDIRKGSQLECINCGLCVDACNAVMDRFKLPRGLIRYDSIAAQAARAAKRPGKTRFLRPRTFIYALVLAAVGGVMIASLATRDRLGLNVIHERSPLFVRLSDGSVRNSYTLKTLNMLRQERQLEFAIEGIAPSQATIVGQEADGARAKLVVGADRVGEFRLFLTLPADRVPKGSVPVTLRITDPQTGEEASARDIFAGPER